MIKIIMKILDNIEDKILGKAKIIRKYYCIRYYCFKNFFEQFNN
jgi:hypothetical protein